MWIFFTRITFFTIFVFYMFMWYCMFTGFLLNIRLDIWSVLKKEMLANENLSQEDGPKIL